MKEVFANVGEYVACGIFTKGHLVLFTITIIGILIVRIGRQY